MINAARRRLHKLAASPDFVTRCHEMLPGEWRLDAALDAGAELVVLTPSPNGSRVVAASGGETAQREAHPT